MNDDLTKNAAIYLRPAWRCQWLSLLVALFSFSGFLMFYDLLGGLALGILFIFLAMKVILVRYSSRYMVGPLGIEVTEGIIRRDFTRIEYRHVRGSRFKQSGFGRIFGVGRIIISTSSAESELQLRDIRNPGYINGIIIGRLKMLAD